MTFSVLEEALAEMDALRADLESERTARREAEFNVNVTLPELREQVAQLIAAVEEHERAPIHEIEESRKRLLKRVRSISQGEADG